MTNDDIKDIEALISGCYQGKLTIGLTNKGSHEANTQFIKECLEWETSTEVWSTLEDNGTPEGGKIIAFTGNGPTSKANAVLFMHARSIIKELLAEREELKQALERASN